MKIGSGSKETLMVFYLDSRRHLIDYELYRNDYVTKDSEVAQKAYRELHEIFHTQKALFEVCPPEGK